MHVLELSVQGQQMSETTHNHFKLARGKELTSNYEYVMILLIDE